MAAEIKHRPHYTVRDYEHWEGRWELIQGLPYAMSPQPSIRHQQVSQNIASLLAEALETCPACRPLLPVDWKLSEDTILQPDNLVVCGEVEGQYLTEPPVLIFEVLSPSTAYKDRAVKFSLYEEQGVPHYVLVDPAETSVVAFELVEGGYRKRTVEQTGDLAFDLGPCRIALDLQRLWRR